MNRIISIVATLLLVGCSSIIAGPAASEVVKGYTIAYGPACDISDLSTESMALITRWWLLNEKGKDKTLTSEEYNEGEALFESGQCGLLLGDIPVVIVLLDGTIYLGRFPDGSLMGFTSDSFREAGDSFKEFRE